jgi:hypothetical protein
MQEDLNIQQRHWEDVRTRTIWKAAALYRGPDKSLARPTSRCILFDGENISFDASIVIYIVLIFLQLW